MIVTATMISHLEKGESLARAASYAWTSIAFPMLTGTSVTVAGFVPIGRNDSAAGKFTFSRFVVVAVSLLFSWVVAVLFARLLRVTFLPQNASIAETSEQMPRFAQALGGDERVVLWSTYVGRPGSCLAMTCQPGRKTWGRS